MPGKMQKEIACYRPGKCKSSTKKMHVIEKQNTSYRQKKRMSLTKKFYPPKKKEEKNASHQLPKMQSIDLTMQVIDQESASH